MDEIIKDKRRLELVAPHDKKVQKNSFFPYLLSDQVW